MIRNDKVQAQTAPPEMFVDVGASLLKNVEIENGKGATDGA
jgi:hypothetical protein